MTRTLSPRAQEILAALEREAAARRSDAQLGMRPSATPQATEPVAEREPPSELPALVAGALAHTEVARQHLSALAEAVEAFAGRRGLPDRATRPEPEPSTQPAATTAPGIASQAVAPADATSPIALRRLSGRAARRLAVDMAAAGAARDAVGDRLRSLHGIADPTPTLDLVFGSEQRNEDRGDLGSDGWADPPAAPAVERTDPTRLEPAGPAEQPLAEAPVWLQEQSLEVIDLHHHLLPGIDDGPRTLDDALALARAAVAAGTTTVVATPHVSRDYPANSAASITEHVAAFANALAAASIPLRVLPGAEVELVHAVDLTDEELTALRLGAGPYLLVGCPLTPNGAGFELLLEALLERGHQILLAHPERCHTFQRDTGMMARLASRGVLSQVTASSLTGGFGRTVREVAHRFMRDGLAHVVASDAHSVDRRPPALLGEVKREGYAEQAARLVGQVPRAIIDGDRVTVMRAMGAGAGSGSATPAPAGEPLHSGGSALRMAADLAAAGGSRGSVGDWLRSLYGIPDPTSTLDSVFGVGTADEARSALDLDPANGTPGAMRPAPAERPATGLVAVTTPETVEPAAAAAREGGAPPIKRSPALEVIDLHHHLLPGIDDGPRTLNDALALARAAVAAGTTTVVATPHVSRGHPRNTAAGIAEGVAALEEALSAASIPLRVLAGAEVAVTHAGDLSDAELTALRLASGPYLLVECPLAPTGDNLELLLEALLERGHRILLAHPERCHTFQRDAGMMARLVSRGVLSQVTAGSLTGGFGRTVREVAHRFMRDGLVHVVASDAHSVDRRPPSLLSHLEQEGYAEQAAWLVGLIPRAILEGGPLPPMSVVPPLPRSGLKRLLGR